MQGTHFPITVHVPGTLAANVSVVFQFPFDVQLVQVSAVGSNANNGLLDIGSSADADLYLDNKDLGDSSAPAVFDKPSDFVGSVFPHIVAGTIIIVALDFDGAAGTATHDFTAVLIFTEG
jgi:hypothetical protein